MTCSRSGIKKALLDRPFTDSASFLENIAVRQHPTVTQSSAARLSVYAGDREAVSTPRVVLVLPTGGRADSLCQRCGLLQSDETVYRHNTVVRDKFLCSEPASALDDVSHLLLFTPSTQNSRGKVNQLLDPVHLRLVANAVHRQTVSYG